MHPEPRPGPVPVGEVIAGMALAGAAGGGPPGPSWPQLMADLAELDEAGALGAIREIIAARLAYVRAGHAPARIGVAEPYIPGNFARAAAALIELPDVDDLAGSYVRAAAWLAAQVDQDGREDRNAARPGPGGQP